MKLLDAVAQYVTLKQSMGMRFNSEQRILKSFCCHQEGKDLAEIEPGPVLEFIAGNGPPTRFWHRKHETLNGFYRFAIARRYVDGSPLPKHVPKVSRLFVPYIYPRIELKRLLDAAEPCFANPRCRIDAATYRTLILLLYGAGLRIGEAVSLTLADVDLDASLLHIRESKFYMSRLVPVGADLQNVLAQHVARRHADRADSDSPLFVRRPGNRLTRAAAENAFCRLRIHANVLRHDGARYQPRLHDLRHTAATHRLQFWYESGADVQRLLPQLATYLGHVHISGTQNYLALTLRFCSKRVGALNAMPRVTTMSKASPSILGPWIRRFLLEHLVGECNLARNTRLSYRDALCLLLPFVSRNLHKEIDRLTVEDLSADQVREFLADLETGRHCSIATRNQRLAAIHALARFVGEHSPEHIAWCAQVRCVPFKKTARASIGYLDKPEMDALLAAPNRRNPQGQRDYALLLFLYNSGARASEAATLRIQDLHLAPSFVRIVGKGGKQRDCPLWPHTVDALISLVGQRAPTEHVFLNRRRVPVTRFGIHTLVERHGLTAQERMPSMKDKRISPHSIRHSTACHLLRAGNDINTIRGWLGHVSLDTTNVYAEVDLQMKAEALAKCEIIDGKEPSRRWRQPEVMAFLRTI